MNVSSAELRLTRKLLKKAQEFIPFIRQGPTPIPYPRSATHPALVVELLPLLQKTVHEWAKPYAEKIAELAYEASAWPLVSESNVESAIQSWVKNPIHQHTRVYMIRPQQWMFIDLLRRALGLKPTDLASKQAVGEILENLKQSLTTRPKSGEKATAWPLNPFLLYSLSPRVGGLAQQTRWLNPIFPSWLGGVTPAGTPAMIVKLLYDWPTIYLHELGHTLNPHALVLDFSRPPLTPALSMLHPELTNAALLREAMPAVINRIASEHPNPFAIESAGRLFHDTLFDYREYLEALNESFSRFFGPKIDPLLIDTSLYPMDPTYKVNLPPELQRRFEAAISPSSEREFDLVKNRQAFMNALNHLLIMPELLKHPKYPKAKLVEILNAYKNMRENPAMKEIYEMAAYGPKSMEEVRDLTSKILAEFPEIKHTKAHRTLQKTLQLPGLFSK